MPDDYDHQFWKTLAAQPLRQAARLALFQARWLAPRRLADARLMRVARRAGCGVVPTPGLLRPPPHHYQGYNGPWIEDYFHRHWLHKAYRTEVAYVPVFWTDLYLHAQTHRFTPGQ